MAKEITLENLAEKMDQGFEKVDKKIDDGFKRVDEKFKEAEIHFDKKIDEKIDGLALAVAKGFDENTKQHQKIFKVLNNHTELLNNHTERFNKVDEKFGNVDARLDIIETDVKGIKQEIIPLERHNDLKSRVDLLEEKAGIVS